MGCLRLGGGGGWGSHGVGPEPDPPVGAEVLHESERTRVTRLLLPGGTVIRKEPLGPDAQRRLRHELAVLERLCGVGGVVQLADVPPFPGSIVLVDIGGAAWRNCPCRWRLMS